MVLYQNLGGCTAILPELKWTLTFGDLVAAVVPILAFLLGMGWKTYFENSKKFNEEYSTLAQWLKKLYREIDGWGSQLPCDSSKAKTINGMLEDNPIKFENGIDLDWNEINEQVEQVRKYSEPGTRNTNREFNEERFKQKKKETLKTIKDFSDKVENYYMMNFFPWRLFKHPIIAIRNGINRTKSYFSNGSEDNQS